MSAVKWTNDQINAIYTRSKNILVSAAAGAGKTAVLVERIIQHVLDDKNPVDIDRLLIVTFTNAAALEMKERINARLTDKYLSDPDNKHLKKQMLKINQAKICTLHSFCLDLIKQNYYKLDLPKGLSLDPGFRIADEIEATLLKSEVLEELLEEHYIIENESFLRLVDGFGGQRDDRALQEILLKLYEYSCSQIHPLEWLMEISNTFYADLEDEGIQNLFVHFIESIANSIEEAVEALEEAIVYANKHGGPDVYLSNLYDELNMLEELLKLCYKNGNKNIDRFSSCQVFINEIQKVKFNSLKRCKGEVDDVLKEMVQKLRNTAKKHIAKLQKDFIERTPEKLLQDMTDIAPVMRYLCELVEDFHYKYLEVKLERNIIDFSDIEHFAINLLEKEENGKRVPAELALKLQEHFVEVLVDEYQDTNKVQNAILTYISRERSKLPNLFMVGDVKQSIYAFRLADPGLFLEKFEKYHKSNEENNQRIVLAQNFRSKENVINAVNYIYKQVMNVKLGGIDYDKDAELVYSALYPENEMEEEKRDKVEVHIVERLEEKKIDNDNIDKILEEDIEELDALQLEARVIGKRIMELMQYKKIEYRDIVILLRSTRSVVQTYIEELQKMGIPVYGDMAAGFFDTTEIRLMLSLLRIIDNPRQDISLAAVLRSPVIGLKGEELAHIRLSRKRGDFYDAVRLTARNNRGKLGLKLRRFLLDLKRWRSFARRHSIGELIWLLYSETGYYDYVGALPAGKQRQGNLRVLHDRARVYETTTMKGLFKFLRFLEKLDESNKDLGAAKVLGEKENVVRIMSIHKSKGLEFPVVFLAGLGRKFNFRNLQEDILIDTDLGIGPSWINDKMRLKYPTLAQIAIKHKLKMEMIAEEIRVLYVALTRARESLILVGTVRNITKVVSKYNNIINKETFELPLNIIKRAVCYYDLLIPCLMRHNDGRLLRDKGKLLSENENKFLKDESVWDIFYWNKEELLNNIVNAENSIEDIEQRFKALLPIDRQTNYKDFVDKRLSWQYTQKKLADIPAKMSVTEIKNRYQLLGKDQDIVPYFKYEKQFETKPKFLQKKKLLTAAEIGSAQHMVMRHLDLKSSLDEEDIKRQIQDLIDKEVLTEEQGYAVKVFDIYMFFKKELGQRLRKSPKIMREVPFTFAIPVNEIYPDLDIIDEKIIVQGTIDCLFKEDEEYVLVDYKTDMVSHNMAKELKERYKTQIELYARAVETIMGYKLKEKIIYSFSLGDCLYL